MAIKPQELTDENEQIKTVVKTGTKVIPGSLYPKGPITATAFGKNSSLFGFVTEEKECQLWRIQDAQWEFLGSWQLIKRANAVIFSPDNRYIIVADKFGDVYRVDIESSHGNDMPWRLILGHTSMVSDLVRLLY